MAKPPAPPAPQLEAVGARSLRVNWEAMPSDVSFVMVFLHQEGDLKSLVLDANTNQLKSTGKAHVASKGSALATGLDGALPYLAKVRAFNKSGWGEISPLSAPLPLSNLAGVSPRAASADMYGSIPQSSFSQVSAQPGPSLLKDPPSNRDAGDMQLDDFDV